MEKIVKKTINFLGMLFLERKKVRYIRKRALPPLTF
jgi:preprotein translocase subunit SecE